MNKIVTAVCAAVLLIAFSEKCSSLEYTLENSDNVINSQSDEGLSAFDGTDSLKVRFKPIEKREIHPFFDKLFRDNDYTEEEAFDETNRRVVRQAYQGQTNLYPYVPSGPPYGLEPYPNSKNQTPQWQHSYNNNNHSQSGYPPQPNGYQPNYNNPYGTNTQLPLNNYNQPTFPNYNGYKPSNSSNSNPSGPYGQNPPPNLWQPHYPPNNGQRPYNPPNGNYPTYNNSASTAYPGYKPVIPYNNGSTRPPYGQPGQYQNNSYPGYPSQMPGYKPTNASGIYPYNPNQRPQYPSQGQVNNTHYPQVVPGNQHPVINDNFTQRPGQNPYGSYNVSNWSATTLNSTQGRAPYNNNQNPQYLNSNPGSPYGSQNPYNVPNQRPYQDSTNGQYPSNGYQGNSPGYPNGYNPSIANKPPYGNVSPYGNGPYGNGPPPNQFQYQNGTVHDATKVSPQHFNSY